ncbi:MAG: response regulator [Campylobacterota bacterium]|nr:response regulator [Campylobacterota bacterium]
MKNNTQYNKHDIYYNELLNLISGDMNISSQYVIFETSEGEYYGVNVAKVEELIQNKNIDIIKSSNSEMLTKGVAKIRDNMTVLLNFDDWIGSPVKDEKELKIIILCRYSSARLGLIVKRVIGIQRIQLDSLFEGTQRDEKIAYAVEISVGGEKKMCNIFDFDQISMDIYPNILNMNETLVDDMQIQTNQVTNKTLLVAEDSKLIQNQIKKLLNKMNLKYHIFDNGKLLLEYLSSSNIEDTALIITDIEMPVMDGIELIEQIKQNRKYDQIPLIAHTNMSNSVISTNIMEHGVLDIVDKLDMTGFKEAVEKYCR